MSARRHSLLIAFGANLPSPAGAPADTVRAALTELERRGVHIRRISALYRTPAWPNPKDPPYVNAVASAETLHPPGEVLSILHETETFFGRARSARNAPRALDIDLIDYEGRTQEGPPALPHPRMAGRAFVLVPLQEIVPQWVHPVMGKTVEALIEALPESEVAVIEAVGKIDIP